MNRNATRNNNETVTNEDTRRKMAEDTEFGPRKTIIVLAIVAGCFAVLWPKIFYPMLSTPVSTVHTPDDGLACCDLIFENDVNAVDIMQEMCKNILRHHQVDPRIRDALKSNKLTPQSASFCRDEVLARCGIDLSSFLAEKERLGKTYKQVLEEIRSFNSSLCLKRQFGVPLSQLGTPHLIRYHILMPHSPMRQERRVPPHAGGLHPALQQRGRAIPSSHIVPKVEGRPDHVVMEKIRPPLGAAGRVVPPPSGNSGMGIIMPLYTLGIFLFFLYTIAKVMRKNSDNEIYAEYQNPAAEREFRNKVFNPEALTSAITGSRGYRTERSASPMKPVPTIEELKEQAAGDIEIDQLRQRLVDTEAAMERIVVQMGSLSRTVVQSPQRDTQLQDECTSSSCCSRSQNGVEELDESSGTVTVMGMEMTACCEGGQRISRPTTPIIPQLHSHTERESTPPKPIYLEGALPPHCELLVTDSETQAKNSEDDMEAPVVLSGKMTLSLISHDQNQAQTDDESLDVEENCKRIEDISANIEVDRDSNKMADESKEKHETAKVKVESEVETESELEEDEEDEDEVENNEGVVDVSEDDEDEEKEADEEEVEDDDDDADDDDDDDDEEDDDDDDDDAADEEAKVKNKGTEAEKYAKQTEQQVATIIGDSTDDEEEEEEEEEEEDDDDDDEEDESEDIEPTDDEDSENEGKEEEIEEDDKSDEESLNKKVK